jgi:hypothetical protein
VPIFDEIKQAITSLYEEGGVTRVAQCICELPGLFNDALLRDVIEILLHLPYNGTSCRHFFAWAQILYVSQARMQCMHISYIDHERVAYINK